MNFPVSRLMKSDFIKYYKRHNSPKPKDNFRKLVFIYDISSSSGNYNANLLCYALERDRDIMNPSPIKLLHHKEDDSNPPIEIPFKLGNNEFPYTILKKIIGPHNKIKNDFEYLRFEAFVNKHGFLIFNVFYNNDRTPQFTTGNIGIPNPCPPAKQS